ncbi:hybrid sensor histidine kinase/response regulator [Acaryochloris sp. IP29b_bin.148]|uniref:hybrid sensor histidine kinase/response regulator n=1 Tax=Acaryochloris sp. IP29b_bin.148 TaxID=2969218 RepID=UPI00262E1361|nr:hybrid sensor histidine kinase/response regulator [Acaryochloris sp. IP29b_bin.148]
MMAKSLKSKSTPPDQNDKRLDSSPPDESIQVLLVEDNPGDAFLIQGMLGVKRSDDAIQYQLTHVDKLEDALSALQKQNFSAILLDLSLPDSHGLETLEKVLSHSPTLPIVVFTGLDDETVAMQAVQQGAQDFLVKGQVTPGSLTHAIRYSIERQQNELALKQKTIELERVNKALRKRSLELEAANTELEAFNYTVSHDLRNPLTGIKTGCALLTAYMGDQDPRLQKYLGTIQDYTRHMATLLEGLLQLSNIGRNPIQPQTVNLSSTVQTIARQLLQQEPERNVKFVIPTHILVEGDTHLLWVALENLLGNAWKYTSALNHAQIEFGKTKLTEVSQHPPNADETIAPDQPIFFIRDNGPGFDMSQAERIFLPFQRLTSAEDFSGSGIGLSTVQRIIHCHGGQIWFDAAVNQGATFYWTLAHKQ